MYPSLPAVWCAWLPGWSPPPRWAGPRRSCPGSGRWRWRRPPAAAPHCSCPRTTLRITAQVSRLLYPSYVGWRPQSGLVILSRNNGISTREAAGWQDDKVTHSGEGWVWIFVWAAGSLSASPPGSTQLSPAHRSPTARSPAFFNSSHSTACTKIFVSLSRCKIQEMSGAILRSWDCWKLNPGQSYWECGGERLRTGLTGRGDATVWYHLPAVTDSATAPGRHDLMAPPQYGQWPTILCSDQPHYCGQRPTILCGSDQPYCEFMTNHMQVNM